MDAPVVGAAAPRRRELLLVIGTAAAIGGAVPLFLAGVIGSGRYVPQQDLATDYALAAIWACALGAFILFWPIGWRERLALVGLWIARMAVALGAMLPFERSYPSLDGYSYFLLGSRTAFDPGALGFGNGTENLIQLVALHNVLLPSSYHLQKVSFAFAGLLAVFCLYRAFVLLADRHDLRVLAVLGLFPSLLFWSSVLNKDPLVLLGTALYVLGVIGWYRHGGLRYPVLVAAGIGLAAFIRPWNVAILLAPTFLLVLLRFRSTPARLAAVAAAALVMGLTIRHMAEVFVVATLTDLVAAADMWSQAWAVGGSARTMGGFDSLGDILLFMPQGAFAALFRPLPGEILNPFGLVAGLENLLLLGLAAAALFRLRRADLRHPLLLWALALIAVWAAVYGIVAYQNLGTASRFKLQILPVLLGTLAWLARRKPPQPEPILPK
jgi:hypothetical protein